MPNTLAVHVGARYDRGIDTLLPVFQRGQGSAIVDATFGLDPHWAAARLRVRPSARQLGVPSATPDRFDLIGDRSSTIMSDLEAARLVLR